ncbi:S-Ena type endospore appendage [Paenibacillus sp. PCH8]|uniref:S-Ena type endospore appendage n=1 Tax=Paenibacillus sp. PCH8 TaxID=2066524 RepID=UPI0035BE4008
MNSSLAVTTICGEFHINSATQIEVLTLWSASSTLNVHGTVSINNHKQSNSSVLLNINIMKERVHFLFYRAIPVQGCIILKWNLKRV